MLTDYYYMVTQDDHLFLLDSRYTRKSDFTGIYLFPLSATTTTPHSTPLRRRRKPLVKLLADYSVVVVTNFASGLQQVQFLPF